MWIPFQLTKNDRKWLYKFSNRRFEGVKYIDIRIPVDKSSFLSFDVEFFGVIIPLFVGLEILDAFEMSIDLNKDTLRSQNG